MSDNMKEILLNYMFGALKNNAILVLHSFFEKQQSVGTSILQCSKISLSLNCDKLFKHLVPAKMMLPARAKNVQQNLNGISPHRWIGRPTEFTNAFSIKHFLPEYFSRDSTRDKIFQY
jgi:hypothetical protein